MCWTLIRCQFWHTRSLIDPRWLIQSTEEIVSVTALELLHDPSPPVCTDTQEVSRVSPDGVTSESSSLSSLLWRWLCEHERFGSFGFLAALKGLWQRACFCVKSCNVGILDNDLCTVFSCWQHRMRALTPSVSGDGFGPREKWCLMPV